jgi:hypothetical protein
MDFVDNYRCLLFLFLDEAYSTVYSTFDCTGPSTTQVHSINVPLYESDDIGFMFSCDDSSDQLPLEPSMDYTMGQYFTAGPKLCMNALSAYALGNDKCLEYEYESNFYSFFVHYPWIAFYNAPNCLPSAVDSNLTFPMGCESLLISDDDGGYEYIMDDIHNEGNNNMMISNMADPASFFRDVLKRKGSTDVDTNIVSVSMIQRMKYQLTKLSKNQDPKVFSTEVESKRELGLWYGQDDYNNIHTPDDDFAFTNQFTSFYANYVPATASPPSSSANSTLSTGAIVGIVIGVISAMIIVGVTVAVIFFGWNMFGMVKQSADASIGSNVNKDPTNIELSATSTNPIFSQGNSNMA